MRSYFPYWNFTSCIHTDSRNAIRSAVINLLEQEQECFFFPKTPYLVLNTEKIKTNDFYQKRLVNPYERPPLLIVGLGIGREGWTIIKTYPNDWLFLRTPDGKRPRLSALAMELECDAFHYRVVDNFLCLLLEADSKGKFKFESTSNVNCSLNFSLIEVSNSLQQAMQIKQNYLSNDILNRLDELDAGDYERIDYLLMKALDPFQYYWQTYDLFEEAFCNFEKLNKMNVKLMYFYPPKNYLKSLPIYRDQIEEYWHEAQFRNETEML